MDNKWEKNSKRITADGTYITYWLKGTKFAVTSRRRHIPHANRPGTWDFTDYMLTWDGVKMKTFRTLTEAKAYTETIIERFRKGAESLRNMSHEEMEGAILRSIDNLDQAIKEVQ